MSKGKKASSFKTGMYLLDSFTSGMYNDPLIVYREYIQNAVDSIDLASHQQRSSPEVRIDLAPGQRMITIRDNALGVPSQIAQETLSSIGSSTKADLGLRGFRGIGRLGGIAFSDTAVFRTKARYEAVESVQEWDCKELRRLLSSQKKKALSLEEVFERVTAFRQEHSDRPGDSYFEVTLQGVSSFRNQIFDIEKVRRYLGQIAPVSFDYQQFSYARAIDDFLSSRLRGYCGYNIILNGEPVLKPYGDVVRITKGDGDRIDGVELFEIKNGKDQPFAYGWYGRRRELLGSIVKGDDSSGIRIRAGNIQIGDAHLLDFCFREPRFNGYVPGEVHVASHTLIPNSRRDDFVDNREKGIFYNLIEREVGLPISKEIRLRSRLASNAPTITPFPILESANGSSKQQSIGGTQSVLTASADSKNGDGGGPDSEIEGKLAKSASEIGTSTDRPAHVAMPDIFKSICDQCPNVSKLLIALQANKS
jgi:molecular chaperone HtpG